MLHQTIGALRAETWRAVNQALLVSAKQDRLESGAAVRLDSTVSAALMHEPSDSTLLWDAVRVVTRLLRRAQTLPGAPAVGWARPPAPGQEAGPCHRVQPRAEQKRRLYGELIAAAQASRAELQAAAAGLAEIAGTTAERWRAEVAHYLPLIARVIAQSERRVLNSEAVPAGEKLVSLFEPHADIIVKGGQYGHKLNLVTGKSGLILDIVVETGNPADAERFLPMLDRHIARAGAPPRQTVADVAFHKKCGIAVADMVKSPWVYRRLRNFRAGIEAGISCFKRVYGAARCTWRGLDHLKAYIWSAAVAHNLVLLARLKPAWLRQPRPVTTQLAKSTRPTLLAIRLSRPAPLLPRAPVPARTAPPPALLRH